MPQEHSDWHNNYDEILKTYKTLVSVLCDQDLTIITHDVSQTKQDLSHLDLGGVGFFEYQTNDTWIRDFTPLSTKKNNSPVYHNFIFNGWGDKFTHDKDNAFSNVFFTHLNQELKNVNLRLEGGAVETNSQGIFLARTSSIINRNRNFQSQEQIEKILSEELGVKVFAWLHHGDLVNDDTDAHIDMLARFCTPSTIVYFSCDDKGYPYYSELLMMKEELIKLSFQHGLKLIELPFVYHKDTPATYCNFLLTNDKLIIPSYNHKNDHKAYEILRSLFPQKKTISVDARTLISQGGAIHCASANIYL